MFMRGCLLPPLTELPEPAAGRSQQPARVYSVCSNRVFTRGQVDLCPTRPLPGIYPTRK